MRLIDADALLEELKLSSNWHAENSREFSLLHRDIVIVNEQPTVEAVPVELIKEAITRLRRRRMNLDEDFVDEAWYLTLQIEAFNDLLSEWVERMKEE